jgi:uncharacterized LabA/DUF88 family protein
MNNNNQLKSNEYTFFDNPKSKLNWKKLEESGAKISILWDLENAPPCIDTEPLVNPSLSSFVSNLRTYWKDKGEISDFWCFGSKKFFYRELRESLKAEGILLKDTTLRKSNANIAIIVEITKLIATYKPPHTIVLITGDQDLSAVLNFLVGHRYTVVLISSQTTHQLIPSESLSWQDFYPKTIKPEEDFPETKGYNNNNNNKNFLQNTTNTPTNTPTNTTNTNTPFNNNEVQITSTTGSRMTPNIKQEITVNNNRVIVIEDDDDNPPTPAHATSANNHNHHAVTSTSTTDQSIIHIGSYSCAKGKRPRRT